LLKGKTHQVNKTKFTNYFQLSDKKKKNTISAFGRSKREKLLKRKTMVIVRTQKFVAQAHLE